MFCKYKPEIHPPYTLTTADLLYLADYLKKLKNPSQEEKEAYQHLRQHIARYTKDIKFAHERNEK